MKIDHKIYFRKFSYDSQLVLCGIHICVRSVAE